VIRSVDIGLATEKSNRPDSREAAPGDKTDT
jgi:hypothetical protein